MKPYFAPEIDNWVKPDMKVLQKDLLALFNLMERGLSTTSKEEKKLFMLAGNLLSKYCFLLEKLV